MSGVSNFDLAYITGLVFLNAGIGQNASSKENFMIEKIDTASYST